MISRTDKSIEGIRLASRGLIDIGDPLAIDAFRSVHAYIRAIEEFCVDIPGSDLVVRVCARGPGSTSLSVETPDQWNDVPVRELSLSDLRFVLRLKEHLAQWATGHASLIDILEASKTGFAEEVTR